MDALNAIPLPLMTAAVFLFGLSIGSFANVCIHRMPRKESVVFPDSHCPSCNTPIRAFDNIPVISYLLLGGKCRSCSVKISSVYPAIELAIATLITLCFLWFGPTVEFLIYGLVSATLMIITLIDLEHQIIPDLITLPGIVFGLAAGCYLVGWQDSLLGFFLGGGLFYLLAVITRGGMGGGDIKYIAAAGALMGWQKVLIVIFLGALLGSIIGLLLMALKGKTRKSLIPFGPFLAAATLITIYFGDTLIEFYLGLMTQGL